MKTPARLVYCYDAADAEHRQALEKHLAALHREQLIEGWHEELITAGEDAQRTILQKVRDADVLLPLLSADFLASDRCQAMVAEALLRHDDRRTLVCPIIVRPCDWRRAPLGGLGVLPPDGNAVTNRPNQDQAWLEVASSLRLLIAPPAAPPSGNKANPYRGLSAFQTADQSVFFGREELTRQLWQAVQRLHDRQTRRNQAPLPRLFAVLGPSGSGKSSLVRAGLLSILRQQPAWSAAPPQVATFTPGEHPVERLAQALLPHLPSQRERLDAARLDELEAVLRRPGTDGLASGLRRFAGTLPGIHQAPLLLVVDQFEEVYAQCKDAAEQDLFVALLLHAAGDAQPVVSVVLTLRNDFLGETRRHRELNQIISRQEAHVLVPVMTREELRRAIALPAQQSGHPLDETTTERLLLETRDNETALPLLEFALTRIWESMQAGKTPAETLREMGGAGGALAGKAQAIYKALSKPEQATAQRALVRLVQLGEGTRDTRRRAPLRALCGSGQTEAEVLAVLRPFATENARLVTLSGDGANLLAEVTHEALFDHWTELREWIGESRTYRRFHERADEAARLWDEDQRRTGRLWRRPDLDLLVLYQKRRPEELTTLQTAFLQASEKQQRREKRVRWGSVAAVCVALVVAVGIYLTKERQRRYEAEQALLDTYVEQGRQLLVEKDSPIEAMLWLHRAQARRSANPALPDLIRGARYYVDATHTLLIGHTARVFIATYSPDGKHIVTASEDETARVWEADTGRPVAVLTGHEASVVSATYSQDGKRIVTASSDSTARVWEVDTGRQLAVLTGHTLNILSATYSPDGKRIVTASWDKTARVWDAETGCQLAVLNGHGDKVWSATYSPDSKCIVTASEDQSARVWDAETGRQLAVLTGHDDRVWSATYSPDGKHIVTASRDKTGRVWEAETGRQLAVLNGHKEGVVRATYSPDGKRIVTASDDKTACVWDVETGRQLAVLNGHEAGVWNASYRPDGKRIVTASEDQSARVWEAETGRQLAVLRGHGSIVWNASYSPDGKRIVTASEDKTARLWEADAGRQHAVLDGHGSSVLSATYSPDATRIVTASWDKSARVWEADTGRQLAVLDGHGSMVRSATYSPDGKRIVTASWDKTARVWEADTGRQLAVLSGHGSMVRSATYSPDGKHIVTASADQTACVWEADTGRQLAVFKGHEASVFSATYSPDGKHVVTASADKTARVWEADTGRQLAVLKGHRDIVRSATYSPDGKRIVTTSGDKTARVWEADAGRQLAVLSGHGSMVRSATYSPDGKRIVTASEDKTARVWEAETGRQLAVLTGHVDRVLSATYTPDGRRIVTTSEDNTARVWDISPETQTRDQIAKLIRCKVSFRFDGEDSNVIVPVLPYPSECLPIGWSEPKNISAQIRLPCDVLVRH